MPNLAWWPVVALGRLAAGAAISPLSPLWTADESARVLARAAPRLAIAFAPFAGERPRARSTPPASATSSSRSSAARRPTPRRSRRCSPSTRATPTPSPISAPDDLAAVPFSSGTGGLPKGVRLTHGNLAAAAEQGDLRLRAPAAPTTSARWSLARRAVLPLDRPHARCSALRCASEPTIVTLPRPGTGAAAGARSPRTASRTLRGARRRSSTRWRPTRASTSTTCRACASSSRAARTCTPTCEQRAQRAAGLRGAPGLRDDRGDVHDQRSRSTAPSTPGDASAGSCPAPRRAWSTRRPAPTPSPASRASCGSAARRSCRATTACPSDDRRRHHARRLAAHRRPRRPSATTASSRSATASRS